MNLRNGNLAQHLRLALFAAAFLLVAVASERMLAQHPASIVTQETESDEQRDQLPYRVYAQWAIETFDKNRDGSLTKEEMKEMRSPLLAERFDLNTNGVLSFDEIVAAVSKPSSDHVDQPAAPPRNTQETDSKYIRYATAVFEQYDVDQDGQLSTDEVTKMRRPPSPDYDADGNQKISLAEMVAGMSAERVAENRRAGRPTILVQSDFDLDAGKLAERFFEASIKKNDKNGDRKLDAEEIANASWSTPKWQASDSNSDGELDEDELRVRYRLMFAKYTAENQKADAAIAARKVRPGKSSIAAASSSNETSLRKTATGNTAGVVDVKLFLMRLPLNSTAKQMADAVEMLQRSEATIDSAIAELALQVGVDDYDQIVLSVRDQHEASIQSGGMERQATGINRSARGTTTNYQNIEIGLIAKLNPKIEMGNVAIELIVEKSDLIRLETPEGEEPNDQVVNWSYDSVVQIENDQPALVASSSSGHRWIMAIEAKVR